MKLMFASKAFPILLSKNVTLTNDDICANVWALAEKMVEKYKHERDFLRNENIILMERERIQESTLSTRTKNFLYEAGKMVTFSQIAEKTRTQLLSIRNLGKVSVREIENYMLKEYGVTLKP